MLQSLQSALGNQLLRVMAPGDYALLAPYLTTGHAERGRILFRKGDPVRTVWFPDGGVGSLIAVSAQGTRVECGVFGRDGFAPIAAAMGSDHVPYDGVAQIGHAFHSMDADVFRDALARSPTLQLLILRYVHTLAVQTAYTALSNAAHPIEERLARWLLMCHDRMGEDRMPLTHEFMSIMLAVRRPSVTTSLHVLEGNGFIRSERACVVMQSRAGLEAFAGDSYGPPEREYERLIGPLR